MKNIITAKTDIITKILICLAIFILLYPQIIPVYSDWQMFIDKKDAIIAIFMRLLPVLVLPTVIGLFFLQRWGWLLLMVFEGAYTHRVVTSFIRFPDITITKISITFLVLHILILIYFVLSPKIRMLYFGKKNLEELF